MGKSYPLCPAPVIIIAKNRLNDAIAGIGWRHYFMKMPLLALAMTTHCIEVINPKR